MQKAKTGTRLREQPCARWPKHHQETMEKGRSSCSETCLLCSTVGQTAVQRSGLKHNQHRASRVCGPALWAPSSGSLDGPCPTVSTGQQDHVCKLHNVSSATSPGSRPVTGQAQIPGMGESIPPLMGVGGWGTKIFVQHRGEVARDEWQKRERGSGRGLTDITDPLGQGCGPRPLLSPGSQRGVLSSPGVSWPQGGTCS